ncbi:MAG: hypothetical protein R3253_08640 [Longimicrobiales bacterium]|nr:hypothetical protein [Longimicrobiales bacterium]
MQVRIFSTFTRPGVGLRPRQESQRPLLSQHSRHCPVLEAGSGLGFLVYPPLEEREAYHVEYAGEGQYHFRFFMRNEAGSWNPVFSVTWTLPVGGLGMIREDVEIADPRSGVTEDGALRMARAFVVPEDFGTPPGAVSIRGAYGFRTPEGWDTVYTPVFNVVERPIAPALVIRVETDWYVHHSEFRYVLEPGEGLPGSRNLPIGQVHFVPREEIELVDCGEEEIEELRRAREEFAQAKADVRTRSRYGLEYSPHYSRESKRRRKESEKDEG